MWKYCLNTLFLSAYCILSTSDYHIGPRRFAHNASALTASALAAMNSVDLEVAAAEQSRGGVEAGNQAADTGAASSAPASASASSSSSGAGAAAAAAAPGADIETPMLELVVSGLHASTLYRPFDSKSRVELSGTPGRVRCRQPNHHGQRIFFQLRFIRSVKILV